MCIGTNVYEYRARVPRLLAGKGGGEILYNPKFKNERTFSMIGAGGSIMWLWSWDTYVPSAR